MSVQMCGFLTASSVPGCAGAAGAGGPEEEKGETQGERGGGQILRALCAKPGVEILS